MYADFLDEAAPIVNKPALKEVARHYRNVAELWKAFAESALPDKPFKETRNLLNKRYRLLKRHELNELRKVSIQLDQMMNEMNHAFPLDNPAITTLFTAMQARLDAVYQAEVAALEALKQVTL
jgi:hypothetical protein